ncbi:MAG TPA: hypothetical protein VFS07_00925, partial [Gemmatimonadales bacterium]|nr:hypothetical protein [Gemmatimonadales bacterium]
MRTATLVAALVTAVAAGELVLLYRQYLLVEAHQQATEQAQPYGGALTAAMARRVALLQGFASFLRVSPQLMRDSARLEEYVREVRATTRGVRAFEVVEGGHITVLAPRVGNESALGLDIRHHPDAEVRTKFLRAEAADVVTVTGPFELRQGGSGLVLRQRFRVREGEAVKVAALVLDFEPLLAEAGLGEAAGISFAVVGAGRRVLAGDSAVVARDPAVIGVTLPDDRWQLLVAPRQGWFASIRLRFLLFALGAVLSGALLVVVVHLVASRQAALQVAVGERTRELSEAVARLEEEARQREGTEEQLRQSQRLESL